MGTLAELLAGIPDDSAPEISKEGQVARLLEAADRYISGEIPFKIGDLITPRIDGSTKGAGTPCLVIDLNPHAGYHFHAGELGSSEYGMRINIRVLRLSCRGFVAAWDEAANYEQYTGPTE